MPPQLSVNHGRYFNVCLVYLDDIAAFSNSFDEQLPRLSLVFQRSNKLA